MKRHNAANSTSYHPGRAIPCHFINRTIKTFYPAAMHQTCRSPAIFLDRINDAVISNGPAHLNFLLSAGLFEQSVHRPLMIIARGDMQSVVIASCHLSPLPLLLTSLFFLNQAKLLIILLSCNPRAKKETRNFFK
jgi:hypothetical protein